MNITSVHMFSVVFMLSWFLCAKPAFAGSKGDWMKLLSDTLPVFTTNYSSIFYKQ